MADNPYFPYTHIYHTQQGTKTASAAKNFVRLNEPFAATRKRLSLTASPQKQETTATTTTEPTQATETRNILTQLPANEQPASTSAVEDDDDQEDVTDESSTVTQYKK